MDDLKYSCQSCDCTLWSDYSRKLGVCPECESQDEDDSTDLEERLDYAVVDTTIARGLLPEYQHLLQS